MWRAQLLAACLLAVVAASGRASGQQTGGSSGGSSGSGAAIDGPPIAAAPPGREPAAAAPPAAADPGGGGGSPGLPGGSSTGGVGPPGASWLQVPGSTGRRDLDVQSLLQLRDSVENWDEFYTANGFQGWNDTSSVPVCSWSGVTCADDGTILTLSWQCRTCPVRAVGKLPSGLGALSTLATLDLQSNRFYGTLPSQWGDVDTWPQLQNIYLNDNNLTGTLPEEWGQPGALPSLLQLRVDSNRLTGTLPQNWGIEETSMRELGVIRLSNNSLNGTLPEQWGTPGAFPQLSVLSLDRNNLTGTLPEIWGAPQAMTLLQELYLQTNNLTGGLPLRWGGPQGMARMRFFFAANNPLGGTLPPTWGINGSFPEMKTLDLNNTRLTGTLPPEWGNVDAMPALDALRIERNDLSGSIPPEWVGFDTLSRLVIRPGNPRLCGPPPEGLGFSLCDDRDLTCLRIPINLAPTCEPVTAAARPPAEEMLAQALRSPPAGGGEAAAAPAAVGEAPAAGSSPSGSEPSSTSTSGSDGGGGGANVGAIVGGVVGGVAAVALAAALLAFVLGRRRRERRRQQDLLRQGDFKPSSRPFVSEEEEMERGLGGTPLSPFAAATAVPPRDYSTSHSSRTAAGATGRGSSRTILSETERRSSRFSSLLGVGSGRLGSSSASGLLARWCSQSRTDSLELPSSAEAEGPVPGVPSGGLHVMAQIAEEGSSSQDKRKQSDEDAAMAGALAAVDAHLPSSDSLLGSAAPSPGAGSGSGGGEGGSARLNRFFSAALPWSDWEIRPEELEIAKRPDGSDWVLGSGGFGKVYKALRHGVQPVAVKIIPVRGDQHETAVAATRMEIAVLRACRDANIVQFQGAYLGPDQTMLVTEYMEGGDLLHNIAAGRVSWYKRGKKVALDIAKGLVFLHSRRVVHFDLKSPNILLARDGTAKIADVGMAKIMNQDYVTGVVSTLAWSAPEMLWGAKCTERADIYSFGIVLWEICSGEAPERGRLRDLRVPEECPPEVRQLILECLEARPSQRPTALQLVERLSAASAAPPPGAKIPAARPIAGFAPVAGAAGAAGAGPAARQGGSGSGGASADAVAGQPAAEPVQGLGQAEQEAEAAQQAQQEAAAAQQAQQEAAAAQQAQQAVDAANTQPAAAQPAAAGASGSGSGSAAGEARQAPASEVEQQAGSPVASGAVRAPEQPLPESPQQQQGSPSHANRSQPQPQPPQQQSQQPQFPSQPDSLSPPASPPPPMRLAPTTPPQPTSEQLPVERPGSAEARAALDVEGAAPAAAPAPAGWISSLAAFFSAPPLPSGAMPQLEPPEQPEQAGQ